MEKNKLQIALALGIMCLLLTTAITVQLNTIKEATKIVGTSYAEERLKDEVLRWKEDYEALYRNLEEKEIELEKVRQELTKEDGKGAELEKELSMANDLLGVTELTGSGIIVTLADNDSVKASEVKDDINYYIVHDIDLREIVNELCNAGAEAISINGQRILSTTAITCSGTVIMINGVKLSSPFEISAIGNSESLSGINRPGGTLENIGNTGVITNVEKSNNVTVAKYNGVVTSKYMKSIE